MQTDYLKALNWRYAVKEFDGDYKLPADKLNRILEAARLAPSSYGLEPWQIIHVQNPELRQQIQKSGYGQEKITNASELLVIAAKTDGKAASSDLIDRISKIRNIDKTKLEDFKKTIDSSVESRRNVGNEVGWLQSQTYILLGFILFAAALEGVDACPMEGFIPEKVTKILQLEQEGLVATTMVALGRRSSSDEYADKIKVRQDLAELVQNK
jgi:nitroreductase